MAEQQALELNVGYSGDLGDSLLEVVAALQHQVPGVMVSFRAMSTPRSAPGPGGTVARAIGWSQKSTTTRVPHLGRRPSRRVVPAHHAFGGRPAISLRSSRVSR